RLQHDHEPQRMFARKTERGRSLCLPLGNRHDTRANNLGDKRCSVERKRKEERQELRLYVPAAAKIETCCLGHLKGNWKSASRKDHERQPDNETEARPQDRLPLAC